MLGQQNLPTVKTKNPPARKRKQNNVDVTKGDQHVAAQRLVDETGVGLNEHEIMEVTKNAIQ